MGVSKKQKIKHNNKAKSKISFDEEIVTKDYAQKLVTGQATISSYNKLSGDTESNIDQENVNLNPTVTPPVKQKNRKRSKQLADESHSGGNNELNTVACKKKKLLENSSHETESHNNTEESEEPTENANKKKKESNRSLKRKKHAKLIEDQKLKIELELQKKALNYLSKWKHSRSEWKFEKLRQVWLQQNLFDASRIPNEFWDTVMQYFSGAKGHSRQAVLDSATKLIEQEEQCVEENADEDFKIKLKRARDIVQHLD